jgi:hypothetical protein
MMSMSDTNSIWLVKSPDKVDQEHFRHSAISFSSDQRLENEPLNESADDMNPASPAPVTFYVNKEIGSTNHVL